MLREGTDPSRCPSCRERVTPFAAGCALCGADLDPRRWHGQPRLTQRAGSFTAALRMGPRVGRPRTGSHGWLDTCVSCVLIGLSLSAVAALCAALLTLAGAL
jgi:hypothetical protein